MITNTRRPSFGYSKLWAIKKLPVDFGHQYQILLSFERANSLQRTYTVVIKNSDSNGLSDWKAKAVSHELKALISEGIAYGGVQDPERTAKPIWCYLRDRQTIGVTQKWAVWRESAAAFLRNKSQGEYYSIPSRLRWNQGRSKNVTCKNGASCSMALSE